MSTTTSVRAPWLEDVSADTWDETLEALDAARSIVLTCHLDPDGDALGSLLALYLHLRDSGVDVVASWGNDPFVIPPQYTFLPGLERITPATEVPDAPDLLVTLDTGTPARLGTLRSLLDAAGRTLVIDHHTSSERYGDIHLVAPRAAASASLVEEIIRRRGGHIDRDIATCLYVGLVTDTGRFQYANTDQAAMEFGARLLDRDIAHDEISRQMFATHSFGYLKVLARVLERAAFDAAVGLVWSWIESADLERYGIVLEEVVDVIDVLRLVDAAEVSLLLRPDHVGAWNASLRSKGEIDVGRLAGDLGGGGHAFSAGFGWQEDLSSAVASVRDGIERQR